VVQSTKDRNTPRKGYNFVVIPIAADTKLYGGIMICTDADGNAVAGSDTAGLRFAGVSKEMVDNTGGAAGDKMIVVEQPIIAPMDAAAITQADVGKPVFISDDHTVALSTTNSICCGIIREVELATKVWVDTFYLNIAAAQDAVASDDAEVAAGANPTKAEYDAVVALANENKSVINALITKLKSSRVMGS